MPIVPAAPMIEVRGLEKSFGDVLAVADVTFTVGHGEIVGFLGPNGAGKTTTMRILAGVFPPSAGAVRIDGRDPRVDALACRRAVGYFPEHAPHYPELRVLEFLGFVAEVKRVPRPHRRAAVERVVDACGLGTMLARRVGTLSKGYRQRVGLAQALLGDPPILILDEPTIGLDPEQVIEIRELVRGLRGDRTVLFSSHILSEVEAVCDRVIVIARGRLVGEGSPAELGARLGGRRRLVVRVAAIDGDVEAKLAELRLLAVRRVGEAWHLDAQTNRDITTEIAALVQREGWSLRELREETLDLEEIFLQLVRGEPRT
jgi:ABC-2 type transport system ATP-binding protein